MAFNFNSNSPATPNRKGKGSFFSNAPSTTPAGPPPSHLTNYSTTPAGNPPRSSMIFGSSYNAANNTFGKRSTPGRARKGGFTVPESSPPRSDGDDDDGMEEDADAELDSAILDDIVQSPRGLKRSHNGVVREQPQSGMADVARAFVRDAAPAQLVEADDLVLKTDEVMCNTDVAAREQTGAVERDEAITNGVVEVTKLWNGYAQPATQQGAVGPESDDGLTGAAFLSTLLLQLHHPHSSKPTFAPSASSAIPRRTLTLPKETPSSAVPIPKALLEWLGTYHNPIPDEYQDVHLFQPSPSAHEAFWDVVGSDLVRGRFGRVVRLLRDAGFEHAVTAQDDGGRRGRGYEGRQLENVQEAVERCVRVLEACPAVRYDDWDVKGGDWQIFRQRVRSAVKDLEAFATGKLDEDGDEPTRENIFAKSMDESMSASTARAASRVPWTIYENLKCVYGVLQGGEEIFDYVQDWLEASIAMTVWWDGEGETVVVGRSSMRKSANAKTREVDVAPGNAYRRRLGDMFRAVTTQIEERNFQPDSLDPVQVGLACVMEDSVEAVIEMLRTWSQTVATSVVEIAALGDWLPQSRPSSRGLLDRGFSSEDLMVLSHGPGNGLSQAQSHSINRDEVLISYADLLTSKDVYRSSDGKIVRESWEMAVSVLGRLDDNNAAQDKISDILEGIHLEDEASVDKVLGLCDIMGLSELGRGVAERYADTLSGSTSYGSTLLYYARAHAHPKLKSTLAHLISLSLLQSAALPPKETLDPSLASLLSKDRTSLVSLARVDAEAAEFLSGALSGYAMVRRFYEVRDQNLLLATTATTLLKPLERKREAAKVLTAVIGSAADCIRGGLFDPAVESVVPVDGLLVLLGETLPLLGQDKRIFTQKQIFALMAAVEDIDTVSERIRSGAEDLLKASMKTYRGTSSSSGVLKKSKSNASSMSASLIGSKDLMSGSSSWDMLAESMLQSKEVSGVKRAWDWRQGLDAVAGADVGSHEVLGLLRIALAREVGKGWSAGGV